MSAITPDEAARRYRDALDALSDQRKQIKEDLAFSDPSTYDQWDSDERYRREHDPGGSRPCLVFDQLGQYISNVAGQIDQRPPSIHAIPVADRADQKVAEQLDGMLRYIEYASRAHHHYSRALTSAARAGVGYLVVRPTVTDRGMGWQEPRISSEGDPLRVVLDPWSQELDGSDAQYGFILTPMSYASFEAQFGKRKKKQSFGSDTTGDSESDREEITVAEHWRIEDKTRDMVAVRYSNGDEGSLTVEDYQRASQSERIEVISGYTDKHRCVYWSLLSGVDVLMEEREYPASQLGIVPVYGYVGWSDGRMNYCGIARRAREAQRAYNFHMSEIRAFMSQAPKSPWLVPIRAVRGLEPLWDKAAAESRAYLPYHDVDDAGQPIAPPTRAPLSINLNNHIAGAEQALRDIQASIGMYQANLGAPSNETSGVAIEERKQQGEASTAHFPSHLAASLTQVGRLCLDMIPRLIDSRRTLRVISIDERSNQIVADPKAPEAMSDRGGQITINPNVGRYDVRVVIGASYSTQRQQAQEAYTEMMRASPEMMPAIAPLWAQTLDVPHADKLAQVLTAMAPPPVQAILQPSEQAEDTGTLTAKVDQLQQALNEAIQHAQQAQAEADEATAKLREQEGKLEIEEDKVAIAAYDAQTKRLSAMSGVIPVDQVPSIVQKTINEMLDAPNPWPGEQEMPEAPEEPEQPEGPSPETQQILQSQQALQEGLASLQEMVATLAQAVGKKRKRIPVRGPDGLITEVIDMPDEGATLQ